MSNKYGLILPEKSNQKNLTFQAKLNIFGEESDSEEEDNKKSSLLLRPSHNINRQAKISQEKAVLEDPTVYQYDEIYDSMVSEKKGSSTKSKEEKVKKPKYIENLLKTANKRKIENERRIERQVQKEREKEGDEFADKEVFVTSAYKKKLEELRQEEEKEKREEYLENIGDVTKQSDLGGFYRHLYEQRVGSDKEKPEAECNKDEKVTKPSPKKEAHIKSNSNNRKSRNYRKRKSCESNTMLSEGEIAETDDEINRVNLDDIRAAKKSKVDENLDADSDFSVDDPSSDDDTDKGEKDIKKDDAKKLKDADVKQSESITEQPEVKAPIVAVEPVKEPKVKIDLWKKRTVGEVFDQALKRYYERKSARGY